LEREVRELKDLLDEKDEKIDMLARIRSHSSTSSSSKRGGNTTMQPTIVESPEGEKGKADEVFKIVQSPTFIH
jgi:hypothetical protein